MRLITIAIATIALICSCQQKSEEIYSLQETAVNAKPSFEDTENEPSQNAKLLAKSRVFKRGFKDKDFGFLLESTKGDINTFKLRSTGLKNEFIKTYEIEAQLVDAYFMDLNNDNYKELYLVTQASDNSANLDLMAFATNGLESASQITILDSEINRKMNSDKIYVKENKLYRTFEANQKDHLFLYSLQEEENALLLKALEITSNSN